MSVRRQIVSGACAAGRVLGKLEAVREALQMRDVGACFDSSNSADMMNGQVVTQLSLFDRASKAGDFDLSCSQV